MMPRLHQSLQVQRSSTASSVTAPHFSVQVAVLTAHLGEALRPIPDLILEEGLPSSGTPFVYLVRLAGVSDIDERFCLNSYLDASNVIGALLRLLEGFASGDEHRSTKDLQQVHNEVPGNAQDP